MTIDNEQEQIELVKKLVETKVGWIRLAKLIKNSADPVAAKEEYISLIGKFASKELTEDENGVVATVSEFDTLVSNLDAYLDKTK